MEHLLKRKIRELDLVSILVFKSIYDSGQANIVAKELRISAPKVSRCLNSLRLAFNDELFYRRQQALRPTPFADKLYPIACNICGSVSQLEAPSFSNLFEQDNAVLHMAVTPVVMRPLAKLLSKKSVQNQVGQVRLSLWDDHSMEQIHKGELDFGLGFESNHEHELIQQKVGGCHSICIVAKDTHPLWKFKDNLSLEAICEYPFLYISGKGFNDKIDPLEQYSRENGLPLKNISFVKTYEEWLAHLQTINSFSFAPIFELDIANNIPGLKAEVLPQIEADKLHSSLKEPQFYFIERTNQYQRYDSITRDKLMVLLQNFFNLSSDFDI